MLMLMSIAAFSMWYNKYMNIAAIIVSVVVAFFGFAGGGGSSSGGGGGGGGSSSSSSSSSSSGDSDPLITSIMFVVAILFVVYGIFDGKRHGVFGYKDYNKTEAEKRIHEAAEHIFKSYQADWSEFKVDNIKTYTTDHYYKHAVLMLELLRNMHRTNKVSQLQVYKVSLLNPVNEKTTFPAKIRVAFGFAGLDEVIEDNGNKLYHQYVANVSEVWNFIYDGQTLKLDGISQPTESAPHLVKSLATFAQDNNLFYSPDWGRYCLPARGLIFGGASMKVADINNHVIGKWNDLLIQLYTYSETPSQYTPGYYIVGQINVPKNYLGVVVKSRKFKTGRKPDKSYEKFEMEWNDFNNRYEVYAASRDALPAFELLNPKFMEFLYDKNPSYNLEVVDNVIYIYAKINHITEKDYKDLLEVLRAAYNELKM